MLAGLGRTLEEAAGAAGRLLWALTVWWAVLVGLAVMAEQALCGRCWGYFMAAEEVRGAAGRIMIRDQKA